MSLRLRLAPLALLGGLLFAPEVRADAGPPPLPPARRITYENAIGLRVNPIGLEEQLTVSYRHRMYASDSLVLRDNHIGFAFMPTLSPAVLRMGGVLEVRPATVLNLSVGAFQATYFGAFGSMRSFPNATVAAYSNDELKDAQDAELTYLTSAVELQARAQALAKVGPIVLREDAVLTYQEARLHDGDRVFYNTRIDQLVPDEGLTLTSDTDLVYLSDFGLVAGVRGTVLKSFLDAEQVGPARADGEDTTLAARVGPLVAYTFFDHPGAAWNKPTVVAMTGFWLAHPYRAGQDVSQGFPWAILALRFEGELWRGDSKR